MPTYMYKCTDCDHRFEEVQGFDDEPLDTCPDCGGAARRVIGNVGVTFKGSGFYRTDSRKALETKKKPELTAGSGSKTKDTKTSPSSTNTSTGKKSDGGSASSSSTKS